MQEHPVGSDTAGTDEYGLPIRPPCPFCDGHDTALISPFGSALSVAAFWCNRCHTAFELLKWRQTAPPRPHPDGETGRRGDGESYGTPDD
jgi:hypothetical protein